MPNPGSYKDFTEREGLVSSPDAIEAYSLALDGFRAELAARRGVSKEDLHTLPLVWVSEEVC